MSNYYQPKICNTWCPSEQWGCCGRTNMTSKPAAPVHLTGEWNIGSRPCIQGQKYSAMGGLVNYCSVNGGKEYPGGGTMAPYPFVNYGAVSVPSNPGKMGRIAPPGDCCTLKY